MRLETVAYAGINIVCTVANVDISFSIFWPHICSAYTTALIPHYSKMPKECETYSNLDDRIYGLTAQKRENIGYRDNPSLKQVHRVAKAGAE